MTSARFVKGSHSLTCASTCLFMNRMNYKSLSFARKLVLMYRRQRDYRLSWPRHHAGELKGLPRTAAWFKVSPCKWVYADSRRLVLETWDQ